MFLVVMVDTLGGRRVGLEVGTAYVIPSSGGMGRALEMRRKMMAGWEGATLVL
jgi:hypothetical protein